MRPAHHGTDLAGTALALAGYTLFSLGDGLVKAIANDFPAPAIVLLRYLFGVTALAVLLWRREGRSGFAVPMPWIQLGRGLSVAVGASCFFVALTLMPLAEATAILFVSPVLIALLSALLLGEAAPGRVWVATALAFGGVIIVLRPNFLVIGWAGLLPLANALCLALFIIFNRMVAGRGSALQMQMAVAVTAIPILLVASAIGHASGVPRFHLTVPDWRILGFCAIVAVTATGAQWLLYMATERAPAAHIAPCMYVQLLAASAIGMIFFGEQPDAVAGLGAAMIVAAGLLLWRGQIRQRQGR